MKLKYWTIVLQLLTFAPYAFSQNALDGNKSAQDAGKTDATPGIGETSRKSARLFFNAAYFGEFFVHPGIKTGVEYELAGNGTHKLLAGTNLGYFYQPHLSHDLFVDAEIAYRLTFASGIFLQLNAGVGYTHIFVDGKTYEYTNGVINEASNAGDSYFMPVASLGIGYDFAVINQNQPLKIYLKQTFFGQYPMNHVMIPNVALEVGISTPLSK